MDWQYIINWSGGKDSALALYRLQHKKDCQLHSLFTTVNESSRRVAMHELREELLQRQARALGLELQVLHLPDQPSMEEYNSRVGRALRQMKVEGVSHSAFGDIFLEDLREYREKQMQEVGLRALFPLWQEDTHTLMQEFLRLGFKTIVLSINTDLLDDSFLGRVIDQQFIKDLPHEVDPCGENGEFHTFVFDGPLFQHPVPFEAGRVFERKFPSPVRAGGELNYKFLELL